MMRKRSNTILREKKINEFGFVCGLASLTIASGMVMSCITSTAFADTSTVTTITAIVPSSCSFSSGGGTYNESLDPNTSNNVVTGNNIVTSCNDGSGYAIYAVGYSNDSYTGTNTDLIHSTNTNYNIKTDGSGNYNSSWKMKVTSVSNATIAGSFNTFQNIPSSFTKVASYTTNTTEGIITPSYQINIGNAQPAGVYTGKVKYVLVHPSTMVAGAYTIAYNANGGSGTMTSTTGIYNFEEQTLPASTFTAPSGYRFAGWCTTNTAGSYACDGTSYAAGATVTGLATAGGSVTLYAYWEVIPKTYMQDMTSADCQVNVGTGSNATGIGDEITVYDKRSSNYPSGDDGDYTVRWINGQCWMTQNLRIEGTISATYSNFTGDVFNVSAYDLKTNGASGGECNGSNGYSNACSSTPDSTDLATIGNNATTQTVGRWYNYYAASAGTISTSSNSTVATSDICPSGWKLPTGPNTTADTDINKLVGNTTSGWQDSTTGLSAFGAVPGGGYNNGSLSDATLGTWWSATAYNNATRRYSLVYDSSSGQFYGSGGSRRYSGLSVRCVKSS